MLSSPRSLPLCHGFQKRFNIRLSLSSTVVPWNVCTMFFETVSHVLTGQVFYVYVLEAAKLPSVLVTEYHSGSLLFMCYYYVTIQLSVGACWTDVRPTERHRCWRLRLMEEESVFVGMLICCELANVLILLLGMLRGEGGLVLLWRHGLGWADVGHWRP